MHLPLPVSLSSRRAISRHDLRPRRSTKDILLTRARVTNLGLLLLSLVTAFSVFLNLRHYSSGRGPQHLRYVPPLGVLSTITRDSSLFTLEHLIVVTGHAIWKGTNPSHMFDEDQWVLQPYQKVGKHIAAYYSHILTGVEMTKDDPSALLIFSGGRTQNTSTTSEAESYMRLAVSAGLLTSPDDASSANALSNLRATTEDYALDSYQNLLFSIARFHEYTGHYPSRITVVGYELKRRRFTDLHRSAIRWPRSRFHYVGIDAAGADQEQAQETENLNAYIPFYNDRYGCMNHLASKRRARNPYSRFHPYYTSAPELGPLFNWCTEAGWLYDGHLPWDNLKRP